jgi:undecaprenyl diphosphate synthase
MTLALSYGAREEIVNAIKNISKKVVNKELSLENIDEKTINNHLYTFNLPDVDLMIRTSGEQRISNFLLWQMAYAELYFTDILWPDFREEHFYDAIIDYQNRERRFGKTSEQIAK